MNLFINTIISLALQEDIGSGDITTDYTIDNLSNTQGIIIAKENLVIAGLEIVNKVFNNLDSNIHTSSKFKDGDYVKKNEEIIKVQGNTSNILKGERTALNFLQHLSGIATKTRKYVNELSNTKIKIVDTRKTSPCLRYLEKYAVRIGGGYNHRVGLYDGVLIKDNHIEACGSILQAIKKIKKNVSHLIKIEVEVSCIKEVKQALKAGADVIMLDNMSISEIENSIKIINKKALIEISGNITFEKLKKLAKLEIHLISIGEITHSAPSVDISMKFRMNQS